MKKWIMLVALTIVLLNHLALAQSYSTMAGGYWNDNSTWLNDSPPGAGESVVIQGPVDISFLNPDIHDLTVSSTGSLQNGWNTTFLISGNMIVDGVVTLNNAHPFQIGGNLQITGDFQGSISFTGTADHNLYTADTSHFEPYSYIQALESRIIALSDIYLYGQGYPDLTALEIDLSNGYDLHVSKMRIGNGYSGIRTLLNGADRSIYLNDGGTTYPSQYFYEYCDIQDVTLMGNSYMGYGVNFLGEVINGDSLLTTGGANGLNLGVLGNFTNNGVLSGDIIFNIHNEFTNNGPGQCQELNFVGDGTHVLRTLNANPIIASSRIMGLEGPVIAGSDLYLSILNFGDLFIQNLDLSNGYDLHTQGVRIGSAYYTDQYGFKTKIIGGGNTIFSETENYPEQFYFEQCDLEDVTLMGSTPIHPGVRFLGEVINGDSLFGSAGGWNWALEVEGNFTNLGTINSTLNFNFKGDLQNAGNISYASAIFSGSEDQNIIMLNEQALPGPITLEANIDPTPFYYQWLEGGLPIPEATSDELIFPGGLGSQETTYHCRGTYELLDTLSRRIFVGTEPPPPNFPPQSFELLAPAPGAEVMTLLPLLEWEAAVDPDPNDILNYTLYLDTPAPGIAVIDVGIWTQFQFTEPLLDNTSYYWYVVVDDPAGASVMNSGGLQGFIVNTMNDPPSDFELLLPLDVAILEDPTPAFSWTIPSDADVGGYVDHYNFFLSQDPAFTDELPLSVDSPAYVPNDDLEEDIYYYWQVEAVDNAGGSRLSTRRSLRVNQFNTQPGSFVLATPVEGAQTGLQPLFSWSPSVDIDQNDTVRYTLRYGSSIQDLLQVEVDQATSYTPEMELMDNTAYVWQVMATDLAGASTVTEYGSFFVNLSNDEPQPVDLITPDSVQVLTLRPQMYWTPAVDPDPNDQISYEMHWYSWGTEIDSVLTDTNAVILPRELLDNTQYFWYVISMDDHDGISQSQEVTFWTDLVPEAPVAFALLEPGDNSTGLSVTPSFLWEVSTDPDPMDFVLYTLEISQDSSFNDLVYAFDGLYHNGMSLEPTVPLELNREYWWRVIATDSDALNTTAESFKFTVGTVATDPSNLIPDQVVLQQNFPNPFNPSTTLRFGIPLESSVSLIIYDVGGNRVKTFGSEVKPAGWYQEVWNGLDDGGQPVATGLYLTRFQVGSYSKTVKMLYLK